MTSSQPQDLIRGLPIIGSGPIRFEAVNRKPLNSKLTLLEEETKKTIKAPKVHFRLVEALRSKNKGALPLTLQRGLAISPSTIILRRVILSKGRGKPCTYNYFK